MMTFPTELEPQRTPRSQSYDPSSNLCEPPCFRRLVHSALDHKGEPPNSPRTLKEHVTARGGCARTSDSPRPVSGRRARGERPFSDRAANAFFVPKAEIAENGYDLSINRYKEIVHEEVEYDPPKVILKRLRKLESEIANDLDELEAMLG